MNSEVTAWSSVNYLLLILGSMPSTDKCSMSYWRLLHCYAESPTGQSVGTPALPQPHGFVMLISQYKTRSGSSRDIRPNTAAHKKLLTSPAETWLRTQQTTPLFTTWGLQRKITSKWVPQGILDQLVHCWLESWAYLSAFSFSDEKTHCGENAQRSHQQLHRAAQSHSGEGVSQARAQLQAREGWHLGDDCELPQAAAAVRPLSRLQPGLLSVLEGSCALPFSWLRGFSHPSAGPPAAGPEAPSGPDSRHLLPSLLHPQAHNSAGQWEQRSCVETLVETETETWGGLQTPSPCRKYISSLLIPDGFP